MIEYLKLWIAKKAIDIIAGLVVLSIVIGGFLVLISLGGK